MQVTQTKQIIASHSFSMLCSTQFLLAPPRLYYSFTYVYRYLLNQTLSGEHVCFTIMITAFTILLCSCKTHKHYTKDHIFPLSTQHIRRLAGSFRNESILK